MLATCNAQSELTTLEHGLHALRSGMDVKAYAASVRRGKERLTVQREVMAAVWPKLCSVWNTALVD